MTMEPRTRQVAGSRIMRGGATGYVKGAVIPLDFPALYHPFDCLCVQIVPGFSLEGILVETGAYAGAVKTTYRFTRRE